LAPERFSHELDYFLFHLSGHLRLGLGEKTRHEMRQAVQQGRIPLVETLAGRGRGGGGRLLELLDTAKEKTAEGPASFFRWATEVLDHASYLIKEDKDGRYVDELHAGAERATHEGLSLATFLEELAIDEPAEDGNDDRVTLSTVHRAKGA
jgi:superfamily I DNA/RNA helicase